MPRSNELVFLKEKLSVVEAQGDATYAVSLKRRIRNLQEEVSEFRRGLRRKPWR